MVKPGACDRTRVERHIVRQSKADEFEVICHKAKNLYNAANYVIRQAFFANEEIPSDYDLINLFTRDCQPDYKALPAQTAQQTIRLLRKNWKAYFKAKKAYKENPEPFRGEPKIPKYKPKDGFSIAVFTNQQVRLRRGDSASLSFREGQIHFPKPAGLSSFPTKVDNLVQVRIVPEAMCFVIEVVYKIEPTQAVVDESRVLAIDLGLNNLATCVSNLEVEPFIINGRPLKSLNRYYNKEKARLQSFIGDKGTSKRINRLTFKRNQQVLDYIHKTTAYIRKWCIDHRIGMVVIGKNDGWKNEINLGKKTNQNFVSIPYNKVIEQLEYKLGDVGIQVILSEESYTSKIDHFAFESMEHQEHYLGRRKERGLFVSSTGVAINSDCNGAIGIGRKVIGESFVKRILDSGRGFRPIRINRF